MADSEQVGGVSDKARLLAAQAERRPDSPWENLSVGVVPACPNWLHLAQKRGQHPVLALCWVLKQQKLPTVCG